MAAFPSYFKKKNDQIGTSQSGPHPRRQFSEKNVSAIWIEVVIFKLPLVRRRKMNSRTFRWQNNDQNNGHIRDEIFEIFPAERDGSHTNKWNKSIDTDVEWHFLF